MTWYVYGPAIALVILLLVYFGKIFGMSSNLRTLCAIGAEKKVEFFRSNWKAQRWNLVVIIVVIIGGFIATQHLRKPINIELSENTIKTYRNWGFKIQGNPYCW